jgi:hypothetical protein
LARRGDVEFAFGWRRLASLERYLSVVELVVEGSTDRVGGAFQALFFGNRWFRSDRETTTKLRLSGDWARRIRVRVVMPA